MQNKACELCKATGRFGSRGDPPAGLVGPMGVHLRRLCHQAPPAPALVGWPVSPRKQGETLSACCKKLQGIPVFGTRGRLWTA